MGPLLMRSIMYYRSALYVLGCGYFRTGDSGFSPRWSLQENALDCWVLYPRIGAISFPLFCGLSVNRLSSLKRLRMATSSSGLFYYSHLQVSFIRQVSKFHIFIFLQRPGHSAKEAPVNMLLAMGLGSFFCIFIGCHSGCRLLPNGAEGYNPYDATHVITQFQILAFSGLAFVLMMILKCPLRLHHQFGYRLGVPKVWARLLYFGDWFWNGLNEWAHRFFVDGITDRVCLFLKQGMSTQ